MNNQSKIIPSELKKLTTQEYEFLGITDSIQRELKDSIKLLENFKHFIYHRVPSFGLASLKTCIELREFNTNELQELLKRATKAFPEPKLEGTIIGTEGSPSPPGWVDSILNDNCRDGT